jgi:hypothetical protein
LFALQQVCESISGLVKSVEADLLASLAVRPSVKEAGEKVPRMLEELKRREMLRATVECATEEDED